MIQYPEGDFILSLIGLLAASLAIPLIPIIGFFVGNEFFWKKGKKFKAIVWYSAGPILILSIAYLSIRHDSRVEADRDAQNKIFADLAQDVAKALDKPPVDSSRFDHLMRTTPVGANPKVLVVSKETDGKPELNPIQFLLPTKLHPRTAGEVTAIVVISCSLREAGKYEDGAIAFASDCQVSIVSRATQVILRTQTLSAEPPLAKEVYNDKYGLSAEGKVPAESIVTYIRGALGLPTFWCRFLTTVGDDSECGMEHS